MFSHSLRFTPQNYKNSPTLKKFFLNFLRCFSTHSCGKKTASKARSAETTVNRLRNERQRVKLADETKTIHRAAELRINKLIDNALQLIRRSATFPRISILFRQLRSLSLALQSVNQGIRGSAAFGTSYRTTFLQLIYKGRIPAVSPGRRGNI